MSDIGHIELYLNSKDSLALRYLTENEHALRQNENLPIDQATTGVIHFAIEKFWETLDNLELFSKYNSVVVIRSEDGTDVEFDWETVCDNEDYHTMNEPNTTLGISQADFILLEASLRRVSWFVTRDRYPNREELLRIALRFRAVTIRYWNRREESKKEFGIRTPNGLAPIF